MPASVHISLNVSDLERSVDFYRRFLGEPAKRKSDYAKFVSASPEIHLALQPAPRVSLAGGSLSHLGIRVESVDEVLKWKTALGARGVTTEEEKTESCCYAVQTKFWISDPDGNRWEVYTVLEDVEVKAEAGMTCCQPRTEAVGQGGEERSLSVAACC
ncbi:MAG TPA: ArsI/CadI family heavy metal resistance metalloenzyme [Thermoanaerobaculia bacterium]|nr:ArsI/CadI family heavy metal resistance metalloenzyme [Thermoanaerobaculia bacterium]